MSTKQKVLIVDDERRNQRIVEEILEDMFELQLASSGEEALECIKAGAPDLVLLDIMMPGINGYEVCQTIRKDPSLKFTKIILVSGKAMIDERLKGYEVGADDYMTKPFAPEELLAKSKVFLRLTQIEKEQDEMNRSLDAKIQEKAKLLIDVEMKLMKASKMSAIGEMAGGIAHEINTPLATIALLTEQHLDAISSKELDPVRIEKAFQVIERSVAHIAKIVQGLKFFSREATSDPFTENDVEKIISDTLTICAERFKNHDVKLEIKTLPVSINCSPVQVAQVLLNLLNNSFHAIENMGEKWIKLTVEDLGEFIEISVSDSGSEIPEEIREKLFLPFFTTKGVGKGTGLGLSISKGIAESHKGTLFLDSNSKNTRFVLRLAKNPETVKKVA